MKLTRQTACYNNNNNDDSDDDDDDDDSEDNTKASCYLKPIPY